ncbi:hypothetical protein FOL47_006922 [Perkinsus chesapeaki]|uniref:Thioredoxin domain-containing protein n=1 Tax=Perkinsus chesapeaki TaxID=330153 RepID=A0A7J6LNT8_PERCH|nr:hypothetical protein FOL47_006922 [Perkinsus chesapeaki]
MNLPCLLIIPYLLVGATSPSFVKIKSLEEFNKAIHDNDFVVAVFGSKWCGRLCVWAARAVLETAKILPSDLSGVHGQDEADELEALDHPDNGLLLLKVDGGRKVNGEILAQESVLGYPAIHLYVRGYKHVFEMAYRTPELLHPWIVFIISHSPIRLSASHGSACAGILDLPVGLVALLRAPEGTLWNVINNLGTYADSRIYFAIDRNRTKDEMVYCTSEGLTLPFPSLNADDAPEDVRKAAGMFLDRHTTKRVTLLDPQRVHRYVSGGFPMVVFVLVAVDLKGARERLTELEPSANQLSSTDLWNIWIPALPEIANVMDELTESSWIHLRKHFDIDGAADILTVVVPHVPSSDIGLWRSPGNGPSQDQLSSVAEAWELLHGVQVMLNQWFGLDTTNGRSKQLLAYEPFEERKYILELDGGDLPEAIGSFVADVVRGGIEPRRIAQTHESASRAVQEIHPSIEAMTTDTIPRFMKSPMTPVQLHLLLVYAPWCVHCVTFMWHVLRPLAENSISEQLEIFVIDGTANELPRTLRDHVEGYPTLLMHDGDVMSSYPMYDTANMMHVLEWIKEHFNMAVVSVESDREEL